MILGTGAFRGPLKRLAIYTLPVYDHVLMTEPLTAEQLAAIGWAGREGLTDAGNQFHYYRRTLDDLRKVARKYRTTLTGEGGEFETFVIDAPFFSRRIAIEEASAVYQNYNGILRIERAGLVEK